LSSGCQVALCARVLRLPHNDAALDHREGLIVISSTPKNLPEARVSKAIELTRAEAYVPVALQVVIISTLASALAANGPT
jgi:hypothetical protein